MIKYLVMIHSYQNGMKKYFLNMFYPKIVNMSKKDLKNLMTLTNYISSAELSGQIKRSGGLKFMELFIVMIKIIPTEF